jgi:ketosteroid isomerase-like protein
MPQENVDQAHRAADAYSRRDVDALLEELDPEVEWHSALSTVLSGEATVYRGHDGVREWFRELDDALGEIYVEYSDIRDLGDRVVAIGRIRTRGRESGVETESPLAAVSDLRNGKAVRVRTYLDPKEALEAAGLSE